MLILCSEQNIEKSLSSFVSKEQMSYILTTYKDNEQKEYNFDNLGTFVLVRIIKEEELAYQNMELYRKTGGNILQFCDKKAIKDLQLCTLLDRDNVKSFVEGMLLASYVFDKYVTDTKRINHPFDNLHIISNEITKDDINELVVITDAIERAKNLINETPSVIDSVTLAKSFELMALGTDLKVEIWDKEKIIDQKMGGLLAVNRGSTIAPTFTIMEYKPQKHNNAHPIVLVGKAITYDTGGLNIKPGDYMNDMKSDMAGGAIVGCCLYAISSLHLPIHVIGLIPSTDNRPNNNAYCSGDIINMYDGTNVEVVNTDAEGRMILADALAYAKRLNPTLVIDMATLTGAAQRAIGPYGIVAMQQKADNFIQALERSGKTTYERIVEFPFWKEYDKLIQSDIADIKNSGESFAGMITAGKFLAYFTSYPFIHLDIAGVSMQDKPQDYYTQGATAFGLRLVLDFLKTYYK